MIGIFVLFLLIGCIFLLLGGIVVVIKEDKDGKSLIGVGLGVMVASVVLLAIAFYNDGQVDKTLPNLKDHFCTIEGIHLNYTLGSKYQSDAKALVTALAHNAKCEGSITVQYPGNKPITIPLK